VLDVVQPRLWDIDPVQLLGRRLGAEYRPIALRAAVLVVLGVLATIHAQLIAIRNAEFHRIPDPLGPTLSGSIATGFLLLLVGTLSTVPVPATVPKWLLPLGETLAASLVVGALGQSADQYIPYLLIPLTTAGLTAGLGPAIACASVSSLVFAGTVMVSPNRPDLNLWFWLPLLAADAGISGWAKRVLASQRPTAEYDAAYANAHRLLSELNTVARQLSLGLDPHTLAKALVDDIHAIVPGVHTTVLVRSGGARMVPLVGEPPTDLAETVVHDAWVSADLVRRGRSGATVVAMPVLMGERVVAVVALGASSQDQNLSEDSVKACHATIFAAGPRLASALLFDDVRRLATVDERHRLAREIHDGIAQDMASVGYLIDDITATAADDSVKTRLRGLREHLTGLVDELRLSIFDLRAGVDESVGLARTLGDYVTRVGSQAGLIVHVSTDESPHRLPVATEVELLRIVQEAVTNVRRHAEANNLWLTVVVDPPRAHIVVADDGKGLGVPRPDSVGITGMRERARRIGAVLTVRNRAQGGGVLVEALRQPVQPATSSSQIVTDPDSVTLVTDSASETALAGRQGGGPS
jgi:signal transduction histidine kinase